MKKFLVFFLFIILMPLLYSNDKGVSSELSVEDFFEQYVVKINESHKNLELAQKKNHFERIGTETINGDVSGTLFYAVKIKGIKASVIFRYTNFSVQDDWTFDGELVITSDAMQNGTYTGTITVSGKYPAKVCYDNVKMANGLPASGYYLITRNKKQEKVPYSKYIEICEAYGIEN